LAVGDSRWHGSLPFVLLQPTFLGSLRGNDGPFGRLGQRHILGHAGEELIHFFALAMKHGITASDVKDLVYGFPTFSADIKSLW
jgi:hypothetical protein